MHVLQNYTLKCPECWVELGYPNAQMWVLDSPFENVGMFCCAECSKELIPHSGYSKMSKHTPRDDPTPSWTRMSKSKYRQFLLTEWFQDALRTRDLAWQIIKKRASAEAQKKDVAPARKRNRNE